MKHRLSFALLPQSWRDIPHQVRRATRLAVVVAITALAGGIMLQLSQADTLFNASEAENGSLAGQASTVTASGGSGGAAVRFGFGAPANVQAITGGDSVALLWDMPLDSSYRTEVYRGDSKLATVTPGQGVVRGDKLGTRYIDEAITIGTAYQYKVRFLDADGTPSAFTAVNATPPANKTPVPSVVIDATQASDLTDYLNTHARKEIETWYPKLADLLAYPDYTPRSSMRVFMDPSYTGVAAANSTEGYIRVNPAWLRNNLEDGGGMFIHEAMHLLQAYKNGAPSWVTEGLADWPRDWLTRERFFIPDANSQLGPYFEGAYAMQWLEKKYSAGIIRRINIAAHNGTYTDSIITSVTGGKTPAQVFTEARNARYSSAGPVKSGSLCLGTAGNSLAAGSELQQQTCDGSSSQTWRLRYLDGGPNDTTRKLFSLLASESACADVTNSGTADNTQVQVQVYGCNATSAQAWTVGSNGSLVNANAARCLTPSGGTAGSGVQLVILGCNGSTGQRWTIPD